jgi:hypothetical protein
VHIVPTCATCRIIASRFRSGRIVARRERPPTDNVIGRLAQKPTLVTYARGALGNDPVESASDGLFEIYVVRTMCSRGPRQYEQHHLIIAESKDAALDFVKREYAETYAAIDVSHSIRTATQLMRDGAMPVTILEGFV